MGKVRTPRKRGAFYRLRAELARRRSVTLTDVSARDIMLEVAKTLDALADIEERMARVPEDTADPTPS
jgi:hypothetical protein